MICFQQGTLAPCSNDRYFSWSCIRYACVYKYVQVYIYVHTTYYTSERKKKELKSSSPPTLLPANLEKQ